MEDHKRPGTPLPRIYIISSDQAVVAGTGIRLLKQLSLLPHSVPCIVQIREKQLDTRQLLTLAMNIRALSLPENTLIFVNERLDIALAASLDGVHLPERACSPDKLRPLAPKMILGCSVHSQESLRRAEESGADYLLFSPIFDTPSKRQYGAPQGLKKLGMMCKMTSLPVFALGGITPENAGYCMAEGAYGIAGLSIFQNSDRFIETFEQFYRILTP